MFVCFVIVGVGAGAGVGVRLIVVGLLGTRYLGVYSLTVEICWVPRLDVICESMGAGLTGWECWFVFIVIGVLFGIYVIVVVVVVVVIIDTYPCDYHSPESEYMV